MTNPDVEKIATSRGKTDQNRKHGPLPLLEISLYWVLWISLLLYTMYTIFTASQGKNGWTSIHPSSKKRTQLAPEIYTVRTVNRGGERILQHLLQLSMFDGPLMIDMGELAYSWSVHSKGNKFVRGVKTKATGEAKLNDSFKIFQYLTVRLLGSSGIKAPVVECWSILLSNCRLVDKAEIRTTGRDSHVKMTGLPVKNFENDT